MDTYTDAALMRIYLQESERHHHKALYEVLIEEARDAGLSGATVLRGIRGFGPSSKLLSARILDLTSDLPIVVQIIDRRERVEAFLVRVNELLDEVNSSALVTLDPSRVVRYVPGEGGS
jgi:PII-like signaling protein